MPSDRSNGNRPLASAFLAVVLGSITLFALPSSGMAQSTTPAQRTPKASTPSAQAPVPTLASMDQSTRTQNYTIVELRRFRDAQGAVVSVRERLEVASNGSPRPNFALTFVGVEGEPAGSPLTLEWQQVYGRLAAQFVLHGNFRIRDLASAAANYTIHDFGPVVRANRAARRMVVFPNTIDKAIWVVDVDVQTQVPLYFVEFDTQVRVLSEVEALTFTNSVTPFSNTTTGGVEVPNYAAGCAAMNNPPETVDPDVSVTSEYVLERIEVRNDPLNGQWKMTMSYTDGVDQFLVVQAPGTTDWFAGLPVANQGNVIGRFRDQAMSLLVFWESGVSFHVAGRGSLTRLDELAHAVFVQAINTH